MADDIGIQKAPERIQKELRQNVERIRELLTLALRNANLAAAVNVGSPISFVGSEPKKTSPNVRRRRARERTLPNAHRTLSQSRAGTIARLLGELDVLKPEMNNEQDYCRLVQANKKFLCFRIVRNHPALRLKLENLQAHRQHVRSSRTMTLGSRTRVRPSRCAGEAIVSATCWRTVPHQLLYSGNCGIPTRESRWKSTVTSSAMTSVMLFSIVQQD